jgi:hypothetical protein
MNINTSWRPNTFRNEVRLRVPANYGEHGGAVHYQFRYNAFISLGDGHAHRPMSNELTPGALWGGRVLNATQAAAALNGYGVVTTQSTVLVPTGTASLAMKGEVVA